MSNNKFNEIYDLYDEACSIYCKEVKDNCLEALIKVTNLITGLEELSIVDNNERLAIIIAKLSNFDDYEMINAVFLLLMAKGFKSSHYQLDLVIPETISYLIGYLINHLYKNRYHLKIMDVNLQGGNLLFALANFLQNKDLELFGIEDDALLVRLAESYFNLGMIDIVIYYQSKMMKVFEQVDVIVGSLDHINYNNYSLETIEYEPYLVIENFMNNLNVGGYFIYLVNNDFFLNKSFEQFQEIILEEYTLKGLLSLPSEMFQEGHIGKSILIGQRKVIKDHQIVVVNLPRMSTKEELFQAIEMIDKFIIELKEEEI